MSESDTNLPAAVALGHVPRFESAEQARTVLARQGVKYVLAQFVDIHGVAKAKAVPLAHLESVLGAGAGFAVNMKFPLLVIAVTLALAGCANTWEGVKEDSSKAYNSTKETIHEATE